MEIEWGRKTNSRIDIIACLRRLKMEILFSGDWRKMVWAYSVFWGNCRLIMLVLSGLRLTYDAYSANFICQKKKS